MTTTAEPITTAAEPTLHELQVKFALMLCDLVQWLHYAGYEVVFGEVARSDEQAEINAVGTIGRFELSELIKDKYPLLAQKLMNNGKAGGIRGSLHELRLAADLMLFRDGIYLTQSEDYASAGQYWESRGGAWGGHFSDGNHFSLAYKGKK